MKKILIVALCLLTLPVMAGKKKTTVKVNAYTKSLTTLINGSNDFLEENELTSAQIKQMLNETFHSMADNSDFIKANEKYISSQYDKDLIEILKPYYKDMTVQQIDSVIAINKSGSIHATGESLAKCDDAEYRSQRVDETLEATVTAKNDKAKQKAIKKIKKDMKKFKSDCPDDYRNIIYDYMLEAGINNLPEDHINAIYHTISAEDLRAYTNSMSCNAYILETQAESSIKEDIYNVHAACISKFQTWTYTAYPSLFTKKQTQTKKQKGRKGKSTKNQSNDTIIEGGEMY